MLQFVTAENAPQLVAALVDLIRGANGVPTKGCAAHLICLLTQQCPNDVQPYAGQSAPSSLSFPFGIDFIVGLVVFLFVCSGKLMAVLVKGLSDRNLALRKTYAAALGHLVRVAKESSVVKLLETLQDRYVDPDEATWHDAQMVTRPIHMESTVT